MSTWPSGGTVPTTNVNESTDDPSLARANIKTSFDTINSILTAYGANDGVATLTSCGDVPRSQLTYSLSDTGGTVTGPITLDADPTANLQAATKQYVDSAIASPAAGELDADGAKIICDADADSWLRASSDDVLDISLRGVNIFQFDGATAGGALANGVKFTATLTTGQPTIEAYGSDATIHLNLKPKGAGGVLVGGFFVHHTGEDWESAEQTLTAGTLITVAHPYSVIPKEVRAILRCKTTEHGYAVNDEVDIHSVSSNNAYGIIGIFVDINNVYAIQNSTAVTINRLDSPVGDVFTITRASWKLVFRARQS